MSLAARCSRDAMSLANTALLVSKQTLYQFYNKRKSCLDTMHTGWSELLLSLKTPCRTCTCQVSRQKNDKHSMLQPVCIVSKQDLRSRSKRRLREIDLHFLNSLFIVHATANIGSASNTDRQHHIHRVVGRCRRRADGVPFVFKTLFED